MQVDMRLHQTVRDQVHAGLSALRVQARQIWGERPQGYEHIDRMAVRLMVGVGDLARLARDGYPHHGTNEDRERYHREVQKELGNVVFSMIRWIDDLGYDVLGCLDLAIEAQEKFAKSGRPR